MPQVLVVDDEELVRNLLRKILVRAGHEVHTADSAQSAITRCAPPACFDLVISDVVMPGIDGHELARWFAVHCPKSRVILMSAMDPGCEFCPYFDRCHRLQKPFVPHQVLGLVAAVLAQPVRSHLMGGFPEHD